VARPEHEPTAEQRLLVEALSAYGVTHDLIAGMIGISDETLRKHYRRELDYGLANLTAKVANSLVQKALSQRADAVNAAKFFLQARAGWATEQRHTVNVTHDNRVLEASKRISERRLALLAPAPDAMQEDEDGDGLPN